MSERWVSSLPRSLCEWLNGDSLKEGWENNAYSLSLHPSPPLIPTLALYNLRLRPSPYFSYFWLIGNNRSLHVTVGEVSAAGLFVISHFVSLSHDFLAFCPAVCLCSVRIRRQTLSIASEPYRIVCEQVNMKTPALIIRALLLLLMLYQTGKMTAALWCCYTHCLAAKLYFSFFF